MEKYAKLFAMARKNTSQFYLAIKLIPSDKLEYQTLLGFLESNNSDVRNGARMLLDKVPADMDGETRCIVALFVD